MTVIIGIDPHKSTHTAVAIDGDEQPLARLQVAADRCQTERLLAWAAPLGDERTWAIESAGGLGKLLAQQLVGRRRARRRRAADAVGSGAAVGLDEGVEERPQRRVVHRDRRAASLRAAGRCDVEDHTAVMRLLVDRYDDLIALRTQAACRLHVALRELVAGGAPRRLSADRAAKLLRGVRPDGVAAIERKRLALELLADVRRLDRDIATARQRITDAVARIGHDAARGPRRRPDRGRAHPRSRR